MSNEAGVSAPAMRNPHKTRKDILDAATQEFALHGPAGARVDTIADRTSTSKRMIYYYFGSKKNLYLEVVREAYRNIRSAEVGLNLEELSPERAMRTLIRATLSYFEHHVSSVRIFAYANLDQDNDIEDIGPELREINSTAITTIEKVLTRGRALGAFKTAPPVAGALDIHQLLSSLALYRVEHRKSFGTIFGRDMLEPAINVRTNQFIEEAVMSLVLDPNGSGL